MSRASPLPRSGEFSKAVMVGIIASLRSGLPVPVTENPPDAYGGGTAKMNDPDRRPM
jgi:hypothetical protein